jgi:hypothetical protein
MKRKRDEKRVIRRRGETGSEAEGDKGGVVVRRDTKGVTLETDAQKKGL